MLCVFFFFFKQKTAYEMRISDWSSDVCSSDLDKVPPQQLIAPAVVLDFSAECAVDPDFLLRDAHIEDWEAKHGRIPAGSWVLFRTDWSKRDVDGYTNRREDGAHTPGPATDAIEDRKSTRLNSRH